MAEARTRSADLAPGTRVQFEDGEIFTLARRKVESDPRGGVPFHPGWWCHGCGGLADFVLDDPDGGWSVIEEATDA